MINFAATYLAWALVGYMKDVNELYDIGINSTTLESLLFGALSQQNGVEAYAAEVVFQEVLATNIWRDLATYWWRYDFIFYCYWGELWKPDRIGQPLDDPATLRQIQSDLNRSLRRGLQLIDNAFNLWEQSTGVLGLSHIDPTTVDDPFADFLSTQAPFSTPAPTSTPAPSVFGEGDAVTNMPVNIGRGSIDPGTGTTIDLDPEVTFQTPLDNQLWVCSWQKWFASIECIARLLFCTQYIFCFLLQITIGLASLCGSNSVCGHCHWFFGFKSNCRVPSTSKTAQT